MAAAAGAWLATVSLALLNAAPVRAASEYVILGAGSRPCGSWLQVRSQAAAERDFSEVPPQQRPSGAGFIDLPRQLLDEHRLRRETSLLGRVLRLAKGIRSQVDRFIVLGSGVYLWIKKRNVPIEARLGALQPEGSA